MLCFLSVNSPNACSFSEDDQFLGNELFDMFQLSPDYQPNATGVVAKYDSGSFSPYSQISLFSA